MKRTLNFKTYGHATPQTSRSGCVLVGLQSILYDIFLQFEEVGHFPTLSDIEARSPSSPSYKYTLRQLKKMESDGVIELHPKHRLSVPQRYRVADGTTPVVFNKLTPSGLIVSGRQLSWFLLVEGFEELYGHPPHVEDVVKASGRTRKWAREMLRRLVYRGVLYWKDNKHIGVVRKEWA